LRLLGGRGELTLDLSTVGIDQRLIVLVPTLLHGDVLVMKVVSADVMRGEEGRRALEHGAPIAGQGGRVRPGTKPKFGLCKRFRC
jgi:2-keto-3-deoxy-galactonokinase